MKESIIKTVHTPWGISDHATVYTDEVEFVTTPSHGGFHVTGAALKAIPKEWQAATWNQRGIQGWFEEDCDWCLVVKALPALFEANMVEQANKTFISCFVMSKKLTEKEACL